MINKVTLIGHLGKNPELKKLDNGTSVVRFSLATNENYRDKNDQWQTLTEWHNVICWRNLAERAEKTLSKGKLVYVDGKITYRKYQDKDGVEKYITDIVANTFRILEKREGGDGYSDKNFPSLSDESPSFSSPQKSEGYSGAQDYSQAEEEDDLPF